MATITSTAAGGAWSSTASWVGGVVPGATDSVVIAATSGGITMDAAYTTTGTVTVTNGTFNTANFSLTCQYIASSNSNVRTLTLGSSAITLTNPGGTIDVGTATNLTITANTATITCTGNAVIVILPAAGINFNGTSFVFSGSGLVQINNPMTCANFTRTGTAVKTDSLSFAGTLTSTGTVTITGNSATNRVLVQSNTVGTARTITAANVALSNCDFMDITGAGAASWTGTSLGDCGGNSGITFTSRTLYRVAAGNWSDTNWSLTSGGAAGQNPPLPQDNVVLNAASGVGTITIDMPRACKDLVCTGYAGSLDRTLASSAYGSLTLASGMTLIASPPSLSGRGSHSVDMAGRTWSGNASIGGPNGTYSLSSAFTCTGLLLPQYGTLNTNNFSIVAMAIQANIGAVTLNLGSSTVTLTGTGTVINGGVGTWNGASTIVLSDTSSATKTFAGGGKTYGNLVIQGGALNSVVITGANTFGTITAPAGTVLTLPASTTTTVAGLALTGAAYNGLRLPGSTVTGQYASTPNSAALGITGDIEFVARINLAALNVVEGIVSKVGAWRVLTNSTTGLQLRFGFWNGTAWNEANSITVAYTVGTAIWIKTTRVASTGLTSWYWASDQASEPSSWTSLGFTTLSAGVSLLSSSNVLEVGSRDTGQGVLSGAILRAIVRNGIGGTTVFDADFTQKPWGANSFVESSSNAATVTINGDLAKAGDGRVLLVSSTPGAKATISAATGTINGDYLVVIDSTATGGATFNAGVRSTLSNTTGWNATGSISKSGRCDVPLAERGSGIKKVPLAGRCDVPVTGRASAAKTVPLAGRCLVPLGDRGSGSKRVPLGGRVVVPVFDGGGNPTKTVQLGGRLIIPILVDVSSSQFGPACVTATIEAPCPGDLRTQGSATVIEATVRADGNLVDPAELTLHLRKPDGTSTTMTRASALHVSAGVYRWRVRLDQAGTWHASVTTDDVGTASTKMPPFYVLATT